MAILRIYNTLSKKIEEFKPLKSREASLYTCGPTVYNFATIGNLRTYLFEDFLRRVLEYDGYEVVHAMNVTDVGHLVGEQDFAEDKMDLGARREGKHPLEIAREYEQGFFEDLARLNILPPHKILRATDSIGEQIEIIELLEQKGFTYRDESAVYFETSKFPDYGKLSGQSLSEKKTGARSEVVVDSKKRNPTDFVLWFFLTGRYKHHILHWPSPWGEGFPGWHIECSAISRKLLGQPFDIHTGGVDHIGTHHTNEIAQSEVAFETPLANYWLHGEFLLIDDGRTRLAGGEPRRMGKSQGNAYLLEDLIKREFSPLAYRYLCLSAHYRSKLNFTWDSIEAAQNSLDNLYEKISELQGEPSVAMCDDYAKAFDREVNNDLDMPHALSLLWRLIKKPNPDKLKLSTIKQFDRVLGLDLLAGAEERKQIPQEIKKLAHERETLRQGKSFEQADRLREKIEAEGFVVKDTDEGPLVRKIWSSAG